MELVDAAITLDAQAKAKLSADIRKLTGVENPNSVYQLLEWLEQQGYSLDSLGKAQAKELLKTAKEPVKTVLELRQQFAKSSVKKIYSYAEYSLLRPSCKRNVQLLRCVKNRTMGGQKYSIAESSAEPYHGFDRGTRDCQTRLLR